jgi:pimeloyl-ACP methyl ester carboxylesterase
MFPAELHFPSRSCRRCSALRSRKYAGQWSSQMIETDNRPDLHPVVAVLVHGTFARNSEWCQPNSAFRTDLNQFFGGTVQFIRFRWSGWNLHRARIMAGTRLAARLADVVSSNPNSKIVVIGHSHGGNVIRYAFRHVGKDVGERVGGVVTLATPFVTVKPRQNLAWLRHLVTAFAIGALALSCLVVSLSTMYWVFYALESDYLIGGYALSQIAKFASLPCTFVIFGLLRLIYVDRLGRLATFLGSRLRSLRDKMIETIDPPTIEGVPLLAIEVRADEARFALSASARLSEWTHETLSDDASNCLLAFIVLPMLLIGFSVGMMISYEPDLFWVSLPRFSFSFMGVTEWLFYSIRMIDTLYLLHLAVVLTVVPLVVALLLMLSIGVPRLIKAPVFGEETLYESWLLRSMHSATPVGWTPHIHRLFVVKRRWWQLWLYRHSLIHQTPEVREFIASWIANLTMNRTLEHGWVGKQTRGSEPLIDFENIASTVKASFESIVSPTKEPLEKEPLEEMKRDSPWWVSTGSLHSIWNVKDRPPLGF